MRSELREQEARVKQLYRDLRRTQSRLRAREQRNKRLIRRVARLEANLTEIKQSFSWRVVAPIRKFFGPEIAEIVPSKSRRFAEASSDSRRDPVEAGANAGQRPPEPSVPFASRLETKLWGGFSAAALADLEKLKLSPLSDPEEAAYAAWALARWYAAEDRIDLAYDNIVFSRIATNDPARQTRLARGQILLEADCLTRRGKASLARALLEPEIAAKPNDFSLSLALANTHFGPGGEPAGLVDGRIRLACINSIYERTGLRSIRLRDPSRPLSIGNLASPASAAGEARELVSVIVPCFNAADTIEFAVRGILEQSWANLEVILVDDCSTDHSLDIARRLADADSRMKILSQPRNLGVNQARNRGLLASRGDFITVHDADDWSHPEKLEEQVVQLHKDADSPASMSYWARVDRDLNFVWAYRAQPTFVESNISSLLVRRSVMEKLGGWMPDRDSGDTEFLWRVQKLGEVGMVRRGIPLSFGLLRAASLTRNLAGNNIRTIHYGGRREYRESADHWHGGLDASQLYVDPEGGRIPFPVPSSFFDAGQEKDFDLLVVMDFNLGAGAYHSTMNYIRAAIAGGRKVGLFDWRRYDLDVVAKLNREVRELAQQGKVRIVTPGETIRAGVILVGYPSILQHMIDRFPEVSFDRLVIVVNQMGERLSTGEEVEYDPLAVRANLTGLFGTEGDWVPISGLVRRLMLADPRYPRPYEDTWTPLIETAGWGDAELRWRGGGGTRPVIGRHGRDHANKWPSARQALLQAYCAERDCDVAILGGAQRALDIIGERPQNWQIHDYGSLEIRDFLSRLDFFVHYPHEKYVEEFGRAIIEAMAIGCPVILPEVFESTFGPAALYAPPEKVWETVQRYWRNEALYLERARAGREFVLAHCDWAEFAKRLDRLMAPPGAA